MCTVLAPLVTRNSKLRAKYGGPNGAIPIWDNKKSNPERIPTPLHFYFHSHSVSHPPRFTGNSSAIINPWEHAPEDLTSQLSTSASTLISDRPRSCVAQALVDDSTRPPKTTATTNPPFRNRSPAPPSYCTSALHHQSNFAAICSIYPTLAESTIRWLLRCSRRLTGTAAFVYWRRGVDRNGMKHLAPRLSKRVCVSLSMNGRLRLLFLLAHCT